MSTLPTDTFADAAVDLDGGPSPTPTATSDEAVGSDAVGAAPPWDSSPTDPISTHDSRAAAPLSAAPRRIAAFLHERHRLRMAAVEAAGQTLLLLPEKAVFLPESDTLLVADAHLGKATSFRQLGVPVPSGTTGDTLARISTLVHRLAIKRVVFLGDFLHSAHAQGPTTMRALLRWRELHSALELTLVRGNHDDRAGDPPAVLDIQVFDEPLMHRGLALSHHPRPVADTLVLAGHIHPCVSVGGRAHDWHRLPCFWFTRGVCVLPAFGAFTGMQTVRVRRGERVFAVTPERVVELQSRRP